MDIDMGATPSQKVYLQTEQRLTLWHLDNLYGKPKEYLWINKEK